MSAYSSYSSYVSSALTTASNKYTALRRALLNDETDGDTEDDSHVCRVLRAYYTEKGRQLPEWLPPDPKAPPPPPPQPMVSSVRRQQESSYGQVNRSNGALSDLWGSGGDRGSPQQSLRAGRGGMGMEQSQPPGRAPMSQRPGIVDSYQRGGGGLQPESRPLPSQRAGSYQSSLRSPPADQTPPGSSAGGASAQDRLKARLWGGGRSGSPVSNSSAQSSPGLSSVGSRNPYESSSGSYGGGRDSAPSMSANSPWSGGGDDYGGYSGGSGYGSSGNPYGGGNSSGSGSRPVGLPSGPRRGLPNGPRPPR